MTMANDEEARPTESRVDPGGSLGNTDRVHRLPVHAGALAVGVLAAFAVVGADTVPEGVPILSPRVASHAFGKVAPRTPLTRSLVFTNTGGAPLQIGDFQASCSCVQPAVGTLTVAPGSHAGFEVGVLSPDRSGPFRETLTYTSNDPAHPSGTVTFEGAVFRSVEAIPDFAVLAVTPDSGTNESVHVRIVNHGPDPVDLGEPRGMNPAFDARLVTRNPGFDYQLVVWTTRRLSNANHFGVFKLATSSSEVPELTVTVMVPGLAAVVVTPQEWRLSGGPVVRPEDRFRSFFIRGTTEHALRVTNAAVNVPGARVALDTLEPGRLVVARVELPSGYEPAPGSAAELSLHTNHPRFPRLRIPIGLRLASNPEPSAEQFD